MIGELEMKVLHVVGGMDVGGTETMLMNLYRNIDRGKYEFHFISYYGREGFYDKEIESLGGKIIPMKFSSSLGAIVSIFQLRKLIKENGYEIVHTHTLFNSGIGVFSAWLGGAKVRISHAHTVSEEKNSTLKKIYIWLMRKLIKIFSTNFLACSEKAGEFLFGKEIVKDKRYSFIPNYVDYRKYINNISREEVRRKLNIECDEIVIGHVGRFIPPKNHIFLLKILIELKKRGRKVKAIFVGDGEQRENIEREVSQNDLKDNVIITGMVNNPEKYLKAMDIFLLPSIYEGFGLVLLEAQASAIPCLVSENIQKEVDLELGLLDKLNLSAGEKIWSDKIEEILKRNIKIEKSQIIEAFSKKEYDLDKIVKKLEKIYESGGRK